MSTLYLHIGTPKTATTSIQIFCEANVEILEKKGFCYPRLSYSYPNVMNRRNAHFIVGRRYLENGKRDVQEEDRIWNEEIGKIVEKLQQNMNVILSDESIWYAFSVQKNKYWKLLKRLSQQHSFDIKIIVYLRRQDDFATSWWNQRIKSATSKEIASMKWQEIVMCPDMRKKYMVLDYYENLEKIASIFGRDSICVRIFDRNTFKGTKQNIQSDFLDILGLDLNDDFTLEVPEANQSLKGNSHEIKRIINGLPEYESIRKVVNSSIQVCSEKSNPEYKYSMFSKEERIAFMKQFEESNHLLAKYYLADKNVEPFAIENQNLTKWKPDNPYMYEDIIRFFGEALIVQQEQISMLQKSVSELKKETQYLKQRMDRIVDTIKYPKNWLKYFIK